MVSPVTRSSVIPSAQQISAARSSVQRLVDLPKARGDPVRAGRSLGQGIQSRPVEGVDRIAHRLVVAAQVRGDLRGTLAMRGGEDDLTTAQREGIGSTQPGH